MGTRVQVSDRPKEDPTPLPRQRFKQTASHAPEEDVASQALNLLTADVLEGLPKVRLFAPGALRRFGARAITIALRFLYGCTPTPLGLFAVKTVCARTHRVRHLVHS